MAGLGSIQSRRPREGGGRDGVEITLRFRGKNRTFSAMHIPCTTCGKPADLLETKNDRTRVFKCRNKQCGIVFTMPPYDPTKPGR